MGSGPSVAAIGDNCMDVYPGLGRQYPTGNVVDFAVNMQQLGIPTSVISTTGNDENGQLMLRALRKEKLDITHLKIGNGPTAITYMDMNGTDRVHGEYVEGVLENLEFSQEEIEFASRHSLVHTAFWGKADPYLAELRSNGAIVSFDYATKFDSPLVSKTLPFVDYAFFSLPKETAYDYLATAKSLSPGVVIATFGKDGSLAYDGKEFYKFGVYPAKVINSVGAGDAFIAGFMYAVLNGADIPTCLSSGAKLAASIVENFEPWKTIN